MVEMIDLDVDISPYNDIMGKLGNGHYQSR